MRHRSTLSLADLDSEQTRSGPHPRLRVVGFISCTISVLLPFWVPVSRPLLEIGAKLKLHAHRINVHSSESHPNVSMQARQDHS
jgi:hypothetical protein